MMILVLQLSLKKLNLLEKVVIFNFLLELIFFSGEPRARKLSLILYHDIIIIIIDLVISAERGVHRCHKFLVASGHLESVPQVLRARRCIHLRRLLLASSGLVGLSDGFEVLLGS